jgi:hypothetical protein
MSLAGAGVDPLSPAIDVSDFLQKQTIPAGQATVTWASGAASAPSVPRTRIELPNVGLAHRLYLDFDAASATGYDLTIGAGAAAVAADGEGPWGLIDGISVNVNGGGGVFEVSGFGAYLINAIEDAHKFPQDSPGTVYTTAPTDVASRIFDYPVAADGRPRFGVEIPFSLSEDNVLGMIFLENDATTVDVIIRWGTLADYAALTAGAVATLTMTVTATLEYFDTPPRDAFVAYVLPLLWWGHWWREERQDIASTGRNANAIVHDNHDIYLRILQRARINDVINTDALSDVRLLLNRAFTRYDHSVTTHLRRQRLQIGKDVPAILWDFLTTPTLRDAIRADQYTDIRSVIDITSGTALGTVSYFLTAYEKLINLGAPAAAESFAGVR